MIKETIIYKKYKKLFYYTIPLLTIVVFATVMGSFSIDKRVINRNCLWDMAGRPYEVFLSDLNLPHKVGAIFVSGTPENLVKIEKFYKKHNIGDIFTSQLRSLLFGTKITEYSIAAYINFVFVLSAILFSLFVGYFIFKNGYISIAVFLLIAIFRNSCQGLIYGLPLRHAYAVFNPLLAFCILIIIILSIKNLQKRYWQVFILVGFIIGYIEHCRTSEGYIVVVSLLVFSAVTLLQHLLAKSRDFKRISVNFVIIFILIYVGYFGHRKTIAAFEYHRDRKFNVPATEEKLMSNQASFHNLYVSLFRYDKPNRFGDRLGFDTVYNKYPELKKKFSADINYVELANSKEYNVAIRELYFYFILHNPKHFFTHLIKSIYDYILFLPYYSWTGNKSAHAYLPKINMDVEVAPDDLAPDFKNSSFNWILNLRLRYLPKSPLFWIYFVFAYLLIVEAIYTSFKRFRENSSSIYLLWAMLIYFFFASIVRILIPVHGQGAVVAFNIIIIYNLVRIAVSKGAIKIRNIEMPTWLILLIIVTLFILTGISVSLFKKYSYSTAIKEDFENSIKGWQTYLSTFTNIADGKKERLQITTSRDATGYIYKAIHTDIGKSYKFIVSFKRGSSPHGQIKIGSSIDNPNLYYSGVLSDADWTQYSGKFEAISPVTYIILVNLTPTRGQTVFFDNIIIKEMGQKDE